MRLAILFLVLFCLTSPAKAETENSAPFKQALPGYSYQFPRDDFSHDEFRIEWWYYTGNLAGERKQTFGYQLTFFRVGLEKKNPIDNPSSWKIDNIYFAHMTVSDINNKKFHFFERINRRGIKNAGADSNQLHVWNEDWSLTFKENLSGGFHAGERKIMRGVARATSFFADSFLAVQDSIFYWH